MDGPGNLPAEGWYEDPLHAFDRRWWDGSAWTDRVELGGREHSSPLAIGTANAQAQAASWREVADPPAPPDTATSSARPAAHAGTGFQVERARETWRVQRAPITAFIASLIFIGTGFYMIALESISGDSVAEAFYAGMGWFSIAVGLTVIAFFSRET